VQEEVQGFAREELDCSQGWMAVKQLPCLLNFKQKVLIIISYGCAHNDAVVDCRNIPVHETFPETVAN
jgi:hypothetical protein